MPIEVQEESLGAARDDVLAVFNETRKHAADRARYTWLYENNPDGPAILWTLRDTASGELAGFTVALPRRMWIRGEIVTCWNGADFSIRPKYRALGYALKLRRAAKLGVEAGRAAFLYSHPNERMAVIHEKVGHAKVGRMLRYAKVLRTSRYLASLLKVEPLAKASGAVLDPLLRASSRATRHRPSCETHIVENARFGEEATTLFERTVRELNTADSPKIIGVRDAAYLNWRYADNPLYATHAVVAERDRAWQGYALFMVEEDTLFVKDVFPPRDESAARDLLKAVVRAGYDRGCASVSVTLLESHPWLPFFEEFGFALRPDASDMYAFAREDDHNREIILDPAAWFLTVGDRDV